MKRMALLATLCVATLVVALALWFRGPGASGARGPASPSLSVQQDPGGRGEEGARWAAPSGAGQTRVAREALGSGPTEQERSAALWIEGRVIWPEGASKPDAFVLGIGKAFEGGYDAARVGKDGSFRVAVAPDSGIVRLDLEAPYLVLDPPFAFRADDVPDDIVLRPVLGAHVVGRITLPEGTQRAHTIPGETIWVTDASGGRFTYAPPVAAATIREDLTYDFGVIRAGGPYMLHYEPAGYPEPGFGEFNAEPGTREHADTWLDRGVQISGQVLAGGTPLPGARVAIAQAKVPAFGGAESSGKVLARVETNSEGRFRTIVRAGQLRLEVERAGFEPLGHSLGDLQEDADDLEFELTGVGGGLAGIVLDPEGEGVRRAELRIYDADGKNLLEERSDEARTERDGRFEIQGLGEGPWFVVATARVKSDRIGKRERHWVFESEVRAGAELTLDLKPGEVLLGEVVDDRGRPLERFEIVATPKTYVDFEPFSEESMSKTFSGGEGQFRWGDLPAGRWWLYARTSEEALSQLIELTLHGAEESVRFTVPRRGTLQGRVTLDGRPVAGAHVDTRNGRGPSYPPFSYRPLDLGARTDAQGNFEVSAGPGLVDVWATARDGAESERITLDLEAGGLQVVTLELGGLGRLEVLLDSSMGDVTGREVRLSRRRHAWSDRVTLEGERRRSWDGLTPATYEVELGPSPAKHRATVEVRAGETATVTLGAPPSVEVTGIVRRAGQPVSGLRLRALAQSRSWNGLQVDPFDQPEWHETAADGSYRLMVGAAGRYRFELGGRGKASFDQEVPAEGARIDFDLSSASVRGEVSLADGAPPPAPYDGPEVTDTKTGEKIVFAPVYHFEVRLRRHSSPVPGIEDLRFSRVDRDGQFEFEGVPEGRYILYVQESGDSLGRIALDARVEDGETLDLDIELAAACVMQGTVRDAEGLPASGASLRLITQDRNWLTWFADGSVDADGTYRIEGIGAGEYRLHCADGDDEVESEPILLVPGEERVIDLRFE